MVDMIWPDNGIGARNSCGGLPKSLAQWAGQLSLECESRDSVLREERQRWVALGVSRAQEAEAIGRRGLLTAAMGVMGLLQALVQAFDSAACHSTC